MTRGGTIAEREEETMEEDRRGADERWWVVWRTLLLFCHLTAGGKAGESEVVEHERQQFGVVDCVT